MTGAPEQMAALRLHTRGGPEDLVNDTAPTPTPGTGDVLVEVHAASFTPDELSWPSTWVDRSGHDRVPVIPCHEVSGVVAALGWGAARFSVGDEVYGLTDWYRDGAAAGYVAVEERNLALRPTSVDHLHTATLPLAGLTALQALFDHGDLRAGQGVLVHGAGGGVGTLAVQLAHGAGAHVVGSGRPAVEGLVRELGADGFVAVTGDGAGDAGTVSLIVDLIGGGLDERIWAMLEPGGTVVSVAAPQVPEDLRRHEAQDRYFVVEPDRKGLQDLAARVDAGTVAPVIGATCSLADAAEVIANKQAGGRRGKIAIAVHDPAMP